MPDGTPTNQEPVTVTGPPAPPICTCGATERHAADADRCVRGHVLVGNQARRTHGVRAFETTGRIPDVLRQTVEEFRNAVIGDRGGTSELSTLDAAYIRRLSEVETVARLLAGDLASRGLMTPKGRVRSTFSRWLECLDRWDRLAQRVGTDRRSRNVTSLSAYLTASASIEENTNDIDRES